MIFSSIQGRMQKISQIVRLVFEIVLTEAHGICVTKGLGTGPLPRPRNLNWAKPQTNKNDSAARQVGLYCRRKAGGPARLRSGERGTTGIAARSTSHSLGSCPTEFDDLWRLASLSTVLKR